MKPPFSLYLDRQQMLESETIPDQQSMELWVATALTEEAKYSHHSLDNEYELTVRIVDKNEIQSLNRDYRKKDKPTNVLSFPYEDFSFTTPETLKLPLLGDLVVCHEVVVEEALQQKKSIVDHWAHLLVHGVLHLKAYDHIEDEEANIMEALEAQILKRLNIADPYQ